MSLIVENGSGVADAESLAAVADADVYHAARGNAGWTGDEAIKETALRRGTAYVEGRYRQKWIGLPASASYSYGTGFDLYAAATGYGFDPYDAATARPVQALSWPRVRAFTRDGILLPSNAVPLAVVQATCECALRELVSPGSLSPDVYPGERVTSEQVDVLKVDYAPGGSTTDVLPMLVGVDRILAPVLRSPVSGGLVMRA